MTNRLPTTSRSLPIALIRAREGVMAPIREMLAESGITEQQWRILRVLAEFGPQDASTLAKRASLLLPSLTRIAQGMNSKGLISQIQNEDDRRRQMIAITEAGQSIINENEAQAASIVRDFKAKLGEARYQQLLDLLTVLNPNGDN